MILVIAPFPTKENENDGMIQRVAAIDSLMSQESRTYLHVSFHRFLNSKKETIGNARIYRVNFFVHFFRIFKITKRSSLIYVHSAYNALKILPFFPKNKVIFDAHGVVPEELFGDRRYAASWIASIAERVAIRRSTVVISVTKRMQRHFQNKYNRLSSRDLVYPVIADFDCNSRLATEAIQAKRIADSVIYAGGLQSWQNVEKMIFSSMKRPEFSYTFLTSDPISFLKKLDSSKLRSVVCKSVPASVVKEHYLTHTYGFILRDAILVNAVACPTKLIEYLYWGVIPIVITPKIGDFDEQSIDAISLSDFINGKLPTDVEAGIMRTANRARVEAMIYQARSVRQELISLFSGGSLDDSSS